MVSSSGTVPVKPLNIIQLFQNKGLRIMMNFLWYVRNADLHRDTGIKPVADVVQQFANAHNLDLSSFDALCPGRDQGN